MTFWELLLGFIIILWIILYFYAKSKGQGIIETTKEIIAEIKK
jgi:hypothetical protein